MKEMYSENMLLQDIKKNIYSLIKIGIETGVWTSDVL